MKILPHVNDTLLLAFAIGMLLLIDLNPFATTWLLAKILALLVYIILGAISLRVRPRSAAGAASFVAALGVFAYIVVVALSKQAILA